MRAQSDLAKEGVVLDLHGHYAEARADFQKVLDAAPDSTKSRARRTLAVSYAFTCDIPHVKQYEHQVIDPQMTAGNYLAAADVDNELARILLECGDLNGALETYRAGHDAALRAPALSDTARDLWNFRWEHAQARIAARRGNKADAAQHVAQAKAILDKGTNPDQKRFYPYLTGYVALYTGDYPTAIADLQQADQHDPFILVLLAQAYEKSGDKAQAITYYRKALESDAHNPPNAFARPLAKRKVAAT